MARRRARIAPHHPPQEGRNGAGRESQVNPPSRRRTTRRTTAQQPGHRRGGATTTTSTSTSTRRRGGSNTRRGTRKRKSVQFASATTARPSRKGKSEESESKSAGSDAVQTGALLSPHAPPHKGEGPGQGEGKTPTRAMFLVKLRYLALSLVCASLVIVTGMLWWRDAETEHDSYVDGAYLGVVVVTTIGYGSEVYPRTTEGRFVVLFYIVVGMAVVGYAVSYMSDLCAYSVQLITTRIAFNDAFMGSTDAFVKIRHTELETSTVFASLNPLFQDDVFEVDADPLWKNPEVMLHVGEYISTSSELSYSSLSSLSTDAEAELVVAMQQELNDNELDAIDNTARRRGSGSGSGSDSGGPLGMARSAFQRVFQRNRRHAKEASALRAARDGQPVPVIHFTIWDYDRFTANDLIGVAQIPLAAVRQHWKTFSRPIIPDSHGLDDELLDELIQKSHLIVRLRWETRAKTKLLVHIIGAKGLPVMDRVHFHKILSTALNYTKEALIALALLVVILLIGAAVFSDVEGWSFFEGFYYSMITASTVGTGDFAPKTQTGRALLIPFALIGVAVAAYTISVIQHLTTAKMFRKVIDSSVGTHESLGGSRLSDSTRYSVRFTEAKLKGSSLGRAALSLHDAVSRVPLIVKQIAFLVVTLSICLTTAATYLSQEEDWTWFEGLYVAFATATTIGWGDFAPSHTRTRVFVMIFSLVGLALMTTAVSFMAHIAVIHAAESASEKVNTKIKRWRTSHSILDTTVLDSENMDNMDAVLALLDDLSDAPETDHDSEPASSSPDESEQAESSLGSAPAAAPSSFDVFAKSLIKLAISGLIVIVLCSIGGAVLMLLESRENIPDYFIAVYFMAVALSTVGLGDFVVVDNWARGFLMIYLSFGLGLFAYAITNLQKTATHGFEHAFHTVFVRYQKWEYAIQIRERALARKAAKSGAVHPAMQSQIFHIARGDDDDDDDDFIGGADDSAYDDSDAGRLVRDSYSYSAV